MKSAQKFSPAQTKLLERLGKGVMVYQQASDVLCYAASHDIEIVLSVDGVVEYQNDAYSLDEFLAWRHVPQEGYEKLRMLRYAFLSPEPDYFALNLELTKQCSLGCLHCFHGSRAQCTASQFDMNNITQLLAYKPSEVTLTGGDILLVENLFAILRCLDQNSNNKPHVRLLLHGKGLANQAYVQKLLSQLQSMRNVSVQLRFTIYDVRQAYHDFICGAQGMHTSLQRVVAEVRKQGLAYAVNFPIMQTNMPILEESVKLLQAAHGDNVSFSSMLYHGDKQAVPLHKLHINASQYAALIEQDAYASLTSQYVSLYSHCNHHCRYPLVDATGRVYGCNLPGKKSLENLAEYEDFHSLCGDVYAIRNNPVPLAACDDCEWNAWCKQCKNVLIGNGQLYCEFVCIAAQTFQQRAQRAQAAGYVEYTTFPS